MNNRHVAVVLAAATVLAACGGSDGADDTSADATPDAVAPDDDVARAIVEPPEGATLCGVFVDDYRPVLNNATAFDEPGWEQEAEELVRMAEILEVLAPPEQASNARDNVGYFEALADIESASDFVAGSNAFNLHLGTTC